MLLLAAERTDGVLQDPRPFVLENPWATSPSRLS